MIGPIKGGLQTDVRPWLITDDAFESLENAYIYYGRVRKRFGSRYLNTAVPAAVQQLYSRLGINIGMTDGAGDAMGTVPGAVFAIGQLFAIGDEIFTVYQAGVAMPMLSTGAGVGTYDTTNGNYTFVGAAPNTIIYFYPATSVMGFTNYEDVQVNFEPSLAFDTQFAYQYSFVTNRWERLAGATVPGDDVWTGTNADFFWSTNYQGMFANVRILYTTNNVIADGLRYWDGTVWTTLNPVYNAGMDTIETARLIVTFKNRLLLMDVVESQGGGTRFVNRLRFSQNGSPLEANAWTQVAGKGNFLDLPVQQALINCTFIRDRLIVYAERSTWELVYIGNEVAPFRWQQLNSELGSESTFSIIPFDKLALAIGNVGIHGCNGATVERIDEKIRQTVFEIQNDNRGLDRVAGIRDYYVESVYWTYPQDNGTTFPDKVLVYNYVNNTWAINDDSITAFGYFQPFINQTWGNTFTAWKDMLMAWKDGQLQSQFRKVLAGNQEGYTFTIETDLTVNAAALQVTNVQSGAPYSLFFPGITIIDHNLDVGDFVHFHNLPDIPDLDDEIYQVVQFVDINTITIQRQVNTAFVYNGGATVSRVSRISIMSKQYNFFQSVGKNMFVSKIDFSIDKTEDSEISLSFYSSTSDEMLTQDGVANGSILGDATLDTRPYPINLAPLEQSQEQLWHSINPQLSGEYIQIGIFWSDEQMIEKEIVLDDFQLHAMVFHVRSVGRLQ